MATTNGNRKILDLKRWEFCSPAPIATAAAMFVVSSRHYKQQQLFVTSSTVVYLYNPNEDGYVQVPSPALAGTFGAGACGVAGAVGPTGTATGGSTTTIQTNLTLARDLRGYTVNITAGPAAGETRVILSNTVGTNATITVSSAFSTAITTSSVYRLLTPRYYVLNAITASGTTTAGVFRYYDYATNAWVSLSANAPAAVIGTDSKLVNTPSWIGTDYDTFATGTATSGTTNTISNSAKTWTVNQWTNYQIRISAGTGAGQIRTIASNTSTQITVSANWTTIPDNTSVYNIEGNDDFIYYMGSNAVTLYRYSISGNTWSTLTPTVARAAAPGTGMSGHWVYGVTDASWNDENAIINGRRIYSFRGAAGAILDYYDIAANTWVNAITYSPATETFTTGTKYAYTGDYIYIQKEATGRWFVFSIPESSMNGWNTMTYTQGAAVLGDTSFDVTYVDGATAIRYVYMILNTSTVLLRQMVI